MRNSLCRCLVGMSLAALWAPEVSAAGTPVTVTILRFIQVQDPDPVQVADAINTPDVIGDGDYYARVRIGDHPFERNRSDFKESKDFRPYWTFSRTIDGGGTIPVVIQMWDADEFENNDDIIDLNPQNNVQDLVLNLDLETCTWSGDAGENGTFSQGDGDHEHFGAAEGGEAGKIMFDVACSRTGDIDKDGIPDGVERFGVRDGNGALVADMAALGADPCRPNIMVEIDFMTGAGDGHNHRPSNVALAELRAAFDGAGLLVDTLSEDACPYAGFPTMTGGIGLIAVVDDGVPEQPLSPIDTLDGIRDANFDPDLAPYFHYSLWAHNSTALGNSGVCCSGKDFIVSLGNFAGPDSAGKTQNGTDRQQSGTFMHELGHSLGLTHGGGAGIDTDDDGQSAARNCKPNYLSVMNYLFQFSGLTNADTGVQAIDYSRSDLPDLNEASLRENNGIGDGPLMTAWADTTGSLQAGRGDGGLDWNNMNGIQSTSVAVDLTAVNTISGCGIDGAGQSTPSPRDRLRGWSDWREIQFRAAVAPGAGAPSQLFQEQVTPSQAERIGKFWEDQLRCSPPESGDWVIGKDCTMWRDATAPRDLIVKNNAVLRVAAGVTLDIDFVAHALRVAPGARVQLQPGAGIR